MRTALTGAVLKVHGTRHSPNQDDSRRSGHRPTRPTVRPVNAVSPAKSKGFMVPVSPLCHWELPAKPQNPGKSRTPLRESDTEMPTETSGSRRFVRTQRDFHEAHMRTTGGFNGTTEGGPGEVPHWVYGKTDSRHRKDPRTAELCKCLPANNSRYHHSSYRRRPGNSRRRRGRCNRAP